MGLGQLLHTQKVAGSPHLEHSDHGRVGVQPCSYLRQNQPSVPRWKVHVGEVQGLRVSLA